MRRRLLAGLLLAFAAPAGADAPVPVFRNAFDLDAEYELDRFMGDFPWEWRDRHRASPDGFLSTTGSLNIRHFYNEQRMKTRFPLVEDRLWFRFRFERLQGLERDDAGTEVEIEWSPRPDLFLSVLGDPAFHKSDNAAGLAARWGKSEGRSVKVSWLWPDFDTNYAFSNRSVTEGVEEFYRRYPQEARLQAYWIDGPLSLALEGRLRRPSELDRRALRAPFARSIREHAVAEAALDARRKWADWTLALEAGAWRERGAVREEPASPGADRAVLSERGYARLSAERALTASWRLRGGGGFARMRGQNRFDGAPALRESYGLLDRVFYVYSLHALTPKCLLEGGFLYDRQRLSTRPAGAGLFEDSRSQNRGKVSFQYDFSAGASLRATGAVELDGNQGESFASFDGGTLLFQAAFR